MVIANGPSLITYCGAEIVRVLLHHYNAEQDRVRVFCHTLRRARHHQLRQCLIRRRERLHIVTRNQYQDGHHIFAIHYILLWLHQTRIHITNNQSTLQNATTTNVSAEERQAREARMARVPFYGARTLLLLAINSTTQFGELSCAQKTASDERVQRRTVQHNTIGDVLLTPSSSFDALFAIAVTRVRRVAFTGYYSDASAE